jgi:hypothetical protein
MNNGVNLNYSNMEKRESIRIERKISARVKEKICSVLNISNKGVLLETDMPVYLFPLTEIIHFELEIEGEWIPVHGIVKWVVSDQLNSRIGVFIRRAPELYLNYLKRLYS